MMRMIDPHLTWGDQPTANAFLHTTFEQRPESGPEPPRVLAGPRPVRREHLGQRNPPPVIDFGDVGARDAVEPPDKEVIVFVFGQTVVYREVVLEMRGGT